MAESASAQPRWRRWLGEALFFLGVLIALHYWQTRDMPQGPAPEFQGLLTDGTSLSLAAWRSRHPDEPALLYFWSDWCPICQTVGGSVDAIDRSWPVLTVATQSGSAKHIADWLAERQRRWTTVVDENGGLSARYGLRGVPSFVIIDATGRIRFVESGYTSEFGLRARLLWSRLFPSSGADQASGR
jgi:thiol-disulfide isomerase/thioredoxin